MTERCIDIVKRFEGFSPVIYLCPAGYPTIGYGHVVTPEEREKFKEGITLEQAEEILRRDLMKYELGIKKELKGIAIHDYSMDALISFSYNVGLYAFRTSILKRKILRNELKEAGDEFLRWVYAGGTRLQGLVRRRKTERDLFLEGIN